MADPTCQIQTQNLLISHFLPDSSAQCNFIVKMYNTPEFIAAEGNTGITTPEKAQKHIENRIIPVYEREGYGCFLVSLKNLSDETIPIGCVTLMRGDPDKDDVWLKVPDIGWVVIPEFVGKGFATEAARGLMEWAKGELGLEEIFCFNDEGNLGSRRVAEKLGFVFCGVRKVPVFGGRESRVYCLPGMKDLEEYVGRKEEVDS